VRDTKVIIGGVAENKGSEISHAGPIFLFGKAGRKQGHNVGK